MCSSDLVYQSLLLPCPARLRRSVGQYMIIPLPLLKEVDDIVLGAFSTHVLMRLKNEIINTSVAAWVIHLALYFSSYFHLQCYFRLLPIHLTKIKIALFAKPKSKREKNERRPRPRNETRERADEAWAGQGLPAKREAGI